MPRTSQFFHALSIVVVAVAVAGGAAFAQSELPEYEIVDLGTFGSPGSLTYSTAYGLNEQGDVVGAAEDDSYASHAFLYRNGELIDVGAFNLEYHSATGEAVNVHGQVAGRSIGWSPYWKFPTWVNRPFLATAREAPFDPASGIGIDGEAFGINDRGQMAVTLSLVPEYRTLTRAHFWDPETGLRDIEFPLQPEGDDVESAAWAINQHGQVAGAFVGQDLALHAYIWDSETNAVIDLHNPYANGSGAYALNDRDDAAGWFEDLQLNHYSVVWTQDGRIVPIPAQLRPELPSGTAEDINNLGDVVGWDSTHEGLDPLAWVAFDAVDGQYPESIALIDLLNEADRAEWELWYAYGINDAGQIVGIGIHGGLFRAFLMSPPCPDTGPPEVEILEPLDDSFVVPSSLGFDVVFRSSDEDGGAIEHEVVLIDGCPAFDGDTYGNKDGLLSDEELQIGPGELCRVFAECGFESLLSPEIRVEVTDCGDNVASDAVTLRGGLTLVDADGNGIGDVCEAVAPVAPAAERLGPRDPGETPKTRKTALQPESRRMMRDR